jgi:serine/threonine-protein kinase
MDNLLERVAEFLTAYSAKEADGVLRLVAPDSIAFYGNDYAEVSFTHPAVAGELELDFRLWPAGRFSQIHNASIHMSNGLATAFFDTAFHNDLDGETQPCLLRFATVWGEREGDWYLVQCVNTVLTVGHSAAEMLRQTLESIERTTLMSSILPGIGVALRQLPPMPSLSLEGQTLGKYRVLTPLGAGGMARVYRAYQPGLDRYVAIKVLRTELVEEEEFLARFKREAQAVAALRHPNIVQVYDFDSEGDIYYMVLELLEGNTLKAKLNDYRVRTERLPLAESVRILKEALAGLAYAHQAGLIHRDLKPANLMLTKQGQTVLTDFGIAQMIGGTQYTATGVIMGTVNYMAPEQGLRGQSDACSDVYALGIVFYEMLTGRVPFDGDTPLAIMMKHVNEPLPLPHTLNPEIPESLERILLKALSKQPEDRYQSAAEMADALRAAQATPQESGSADTITRTVTPLGVYSGPARAALTDSDFAQDDTDASLESKLTPIRSTRSSTDVPTRGVKRAIVLGLGSVWVVVLLSLTLGGLTGHLVAFMGVVWPAFVLWLALFMGLLMGALASAAFIIPLSIFFNVGALLSYYTATNNWSAWYWWPALVLFTAGEILALFYWVSPVKRLRARQIGYGASALTGGLMVLLILLATRAAW